MDVYAFDILRKKIKRLRRESRSQFQALYLEIKQMTVAMEVLRQEVERSNTVAASAVALIQGLADRIEASKGDPIALQAIADDLRGGTDELAAAVEANTPSEPEEEE
jgi:hypothetical protein